MRLMRLTANPFSVAIVIFRCAILAAPLVAQEKFDLAKPASQLRDKDVAVRQSAIEALGHCAVL